MDIITVINTYGIAAIAIAAFIVSIITEVIKDIGPLKNVPTNLVVIALSMLVTTTAYFGVSSYFTRAIIWYELIATVVASFVVAFVAMYGWTKLTEVWDRFKR